MQLQLDDHFNVELSADPDTSNRRRQVLQSAFSYVTPRVPSAPRLLHVATEVASLIGLTQEQATSDLFLHVFSGARVPDGAKPYAMCYGGHQFGNWAGQLGDGRAINLAEVSHNGKRWTLQLKGAGETPYSRTADGLAVLRSSLREHLCSEAMHSLGVPTTRSLSLITTGDSVMRDVMYDGNPADEPGAVVCRVAQSFIRFGNFQIFAARQDQDSLRALTDYTIRHYYPALNVDRQGYVDLLREVAQRTMRMIVHWQRVGFVHGVMNTDNMSIHGETIDYGPYGWLEGYDQGWTPNTTDRQFKRYRYGAQGEIALWNLVQLANALYPLVEDAEPLQDVLQTCARQYQQQYYQMLMEKVGLVADPTQDLSESDRELMESLESTLQLTETDMTIFFRLLANVPRSHSVTAHDSFLQPLSDAFYDPEQLQGDTLQAWRDWFTAYLQRLQQDNIDDADRKSRMNAVNPKYVLRNYMAQLAIDKAAEGDATLVEELYDLLQHPYDEQPEQQKWFAKRPEWARHKVGCSMLSCSS